MDKKILFLVCIIFSYVNLAFAIDLRIKDKSTEIYTEPDGPASGVVFNNIIVEQVDERGQWVQAKVTFWVPKTMVERIFLEEKEDITWDEVHTSPIIYQDRKITWICYLDKVGRTSDGQTKWYLLARNLKSKDFKARNDGRFFAHFNKQMEKEVKKYSVGDWVMITGKIMGAGTKAGDEEFGYVVVEVSAVEKVIVK